MSRVGSWKRWPCFYCNLTLRPQKGRLRRPVQRLHRLEASTTQFLSDEFGDSGSNGGESATQVQVCPPLTFLALTLLLVQETVVCVVALYTKWKV